MVFVDRCNGGQLKRMSKELEVGCRAERGVCPRVGLGLQEKGSGCDHGRGGTRGCPCHVPVLLLMDVSGSQPGTWH